MKILQIEFQNIHSLKGAHRIDFSEPPFAGNALFAITGPTGSGKSSILDVISLALFNQVPRLGKISKNEILSKGAILTRNQKEAYARVTYESQRGKFTSHWGISTNRNNNLRDYEMQLFDLDSGRALDLKKSDVPAKNEELIGLNYDQFVKAVVLAQGEFAQFLGAKKEERGALLEKITGTGIYRQLGIRAFQKYKEVSSEIEDQTRALELHRSKLLEDQKRAELSQHLEERETGCGPLEKEIKRLEAHIRLKKDMAQQSEEIESRKQAKEAAEKELKDFLSRHGRSLDRHERIQVFEEDLKTWKHLRDRCSELTRELTATQHQQKENTSALEDCIRRTSDLLGTAVKEDSFEEDLKKFSEKVSGLQRQREEKRSRYRHVLDHFNQQAEAIDFVPQQDLQENKQRLETDQEETQRRLLALQNQLKDLDLDQPQRQLQECRSRLEKAQQAQQQATQLQMLAQETQRLKEDLQKILPLLEKVPLTIEKKQQQVDLLHERHLRLQLQRQNELLRASLEEHRHRLVPGEPCPLCGALEHPFLEQNPSQQDSLQEELQLTERDLNILRDQLATEKASLDHYNQQKEQLEKRITQQESEWSEKQERFNQCFADFLPQNDWGALCEQEKGKITAIEEVVSLLQRQKGLARLLPMIRELQEIRLEGTRLAEKLESLYRGTDLHKDCQELQNSWVRIHQQRVSLNENFQKLQSRYQERNEELRRLDQSLRPKISSEGCKEVNEALDILLPQQEYTKLRGHRIRLMTENEKLQASLETLRLQFERLRKQDCDDPADVLEGNLARNQQMLEALQKECEELRRQLRNDTDLRDQIQQIESRISDKRKHIRKWELLNILIGDATGKKFNDFAQDLTLSQLLYLANQRLKDLSDRYSIDKPVGDEDDGLVAIDLHMGGQRRSVKTLSGGETFILSLSLALALSDLASKNVEINSLFIDEGFGTLDPETLDQTLDTLEKLQAESGKTIGIISHVESLKERIAIQVRLQRNGQGYSSLHLIS